MGFREQFKCTNFGFDHPHPWKFVSGKCNHHCFYGFWRLFWALCHATWVLLSWVTDSWAQHSSTERLKWFIYLTNWTYLLLTLETVLEAINFFCVHMLREDILKGTKSRAPWYLRLQWLLYNIVSTGSCMVTAWYWGALYKGDKGLGAVRFALHAMNSVYVLLNLMITATPFRVLHVIYPVLYGVTYTIFSFVYHLAGGSNVDNQPYIYSVLDWSRPGRAVLMSSLSNFVAIPIMHLMLYFLHYLARKVWSVWRRRREARGGRARSTPSSLCLDLREKNTETSSVQQEPLVSSDVIID